MGHGRMTYPLKTARLVLIVMHVLIFVRLFSNHWIVDENFFSSFLLAHRCDICQSKYRTIHHTTFSWSDRISPKYRKYVIIGEWKRFDFLHRIRCDHQ